MDQQPPHTPAVEMTEIRVLPEQILAKQSLYKAAQSNNLDNFWAELNKFQASYGLQGIVGKVSPGGNSLLHAAAGSGCQSITKSLAEKFPCLTIEKNNADDTPLHSAAKAGKAETTNVLLQCCTDPANLPRMKNLKGNTALHEALIYYNFATNDAEKESYGAVVACMVSADPELAYIANKERKSSLCLAVEITDLKILRCLLDYRQPAAGGICQQLPEGKSAVHAAIKLKKFDMLSEMLDKWPELIDLANRSGRKALHCAASVGNMKVIDFLLQKYPKGIYERDNEGLYPLHVACESGYVKAFNKLFDQWPDTSEFLNKKCQNILHVAAKNGRDYIVRHIVKDPNLGPKFVNATDTEGTTPLHLAALNGHSLVVGTLLLTRKCDSQILNQKGLTAYEVAKERAGDPMDYGKQMGQRNVRSNDQRNEQRNEPCNLHSDVQSNEQTNVQREDVSSKNRRPPDSTDSMMALSILFLLQIFKILCGFRRQRKKRLRHEMKIKKANKEDVKDRTNALLVVATLVAGIAFSAAVQMTSNGEDKDTNLGNGAPIQAPAPSPSSPSLSLFTRLITDQLELTYLEIFIFFDSLAMNLSIFAAIGLCWVQLVDVNFAAFFVWEASILVGAALYSVCIAFGFAMLIVIKEFSTTYITVVIILEALFIVWLTVLTSPIFIPFELKFLFVRGLYVAFFIGYFIVKRLSDCCFFIGYFIVHRLSGCCFSCLRNA